jgi:hypothetical protein
LALALSLACRFCSCDFLRKLMPFVLWEVACSYEKD